MRTIKRLYIIDIEYKGKRKQFITKLSDKSLMRIHDMIINNNPNKKYFYHYIYPNHSRIAYSRYELKRKAGTSVIEYYQDASFKIIEADPKAEESSLRIPYKKVLELIQEFITIKQ